MLILFLFVLIIFIFYFFGRPSRKRNAKRRYDTLSFDRLDDDRYFEMACEEPTYQTVRRTRKTRKKVNYKESESSEESEPPPEITIKKEPEQLQVSEQPLLKIKHEPKPECYKVEINPIIIKTENLTNIKTESKLFTKHNAKLRIKTAAELGSSILFVDCNTKTSSPVPISFQSVFTSSSKSRNDLKIDVDCKLNIKIISRLYKKFFTTENQSRIRKVAEILQNVTESVDRNNERILEINSCKSTDAEKLMLRYQAYSDHKRKLEAHHIALKEQFEIIAKIFNNENFNILFQLFFLGILKIFLVSSPNKKGTLFKRIVSQLSSSLESSGYKNDRVFSVLKGKQFRDECIALVQFIEKYSKTEFFEMLLLTDSDKMKISKKQGLGSEESPPVSSKHLNVSGNFVSELNLENIEVLPCGYNLLLPQLNKGSKSAVVIGNKTSNLLYQHITELSRKSVNTVLSTTSTNITTGTTTIVTVKPSSSSSCQSVAVINSESTCLPQEKSAQSVIHESSCDTSNSGTQDPQNQLITTTQTVRLNPLKNVCLSNNLAPTQNSNLVNSPNLSIVVPASNSMVENSCTLIVPQDSSSQLYSDNTITTPRTSAPSPNSSCLANYINDDEHIPCNSVNQSENLFISSHCNILRPSDSIYSSAVKPNRLPQTVLISVKKNLLPTTAPVPSSSYSSIAQSFRPFSTISSNADFLTSSSSSNASIGLVNMTKKPNDLNTAVSLYGNAINNENIRPSIQSSQLVNINFSYMAESTIPLSNIQSSLIDNSYCNELSSLDDLSLLTRDQQYFNGSASQQNEAIYVSKKKAVSVLIVLYFGVWVPILFFSFK